MKKPRLASAKCVLLCLGFSGPLGGVPVSYGMEAVSVLPDLSWELRLIGTVVPSRVFIAQAAHAGQ